MAKVNEVINTTGGMIAPVIEEPVNLDATTVYVYLPPPQMGEESVLFVGLNGTGYTIPRGRPYPVPRPLFEIIRRSHDAKNVTEQYIAKMEKENADPALR